MPANNRAFWKAKLARNAQRDREVTSTLRKVRWIVLRVWECAWAHNLRGGVPGVLLSAKFRHASGVRRWGVA